MIHKEDLRRRACKGDFPDGNLTPIRKVGRIDMSRSGAPLTIAPLLFAQIQGVRRSP